MKQILLATTAAAALAFGAYGAAAQSDRTDHHHGAPAAIQQHEAAKPAQAQNAPSATQPKSQAGQNQPNLAQRNLPQQQRREQQMNRSSTPPNEAHNAPSAAQTQNQPATARRNLSRHEQQMNGGSTPPNEAQSAPSATQLQNQPASNRQNLSQRERRELGMTGSSTPSNQAHNRLSPSPAQPNTAQRNWSPREQRGRVEQGFAGSTAVPSETGRNARAEGVNAAGPIPQERRAELGQRFARDHLHRVDRVGFSLSVGTVVPRGAPLYPLPADIVSVYPAFRGYEYIAVGDRIAIVQPSTMKIVTIIDERGPAGFYGSAAPPRGAVVISARERVLIRERIHHVSLHRVRHVEFPLAVGAFVPPSVPLYVMPPPIVAVDPALSPYRYVVVEDDFVLVDPEVRRIVAILPT